ncbi:hypothetical protein Ciccas_014401, partial [Cichlidogyrus casuarinus]
SDGTTRQFATGPDPSFCTNYFDLMEAPISLCMSVVDSLSQQNNTCFATFSLLMPSNDALASTINNLASDPSLLDNMSNTGTLDSKGVEFLIFIAGAINKAQKNDNSDAQ